MFLQSYLRPLREQTITLNDALSHLAVYINYVADGHRMHDNGLGLPAPQCREELELYKAVRSHPLLREDVREFLQRVLYMYGGT